MNILLVIGPQGSGNHIWSKVLTTWANKAYWVGHKDEPHSHLWKDVEEWNDHKFPDVETVVSVSIPFAVKGETVFPDIKRWKEIMEDRGLPHEIAVVTRDKTINYFQNDRVRPVNNYINSVEYISSLNVDVFLSTETLMIYKEKYLRILNKQLKFNFPNRYPNLYTILGESYNEKYISYVEDFPLDKSVKEVSEYK